MKKVKFSVYGTVNTLQDNLFYRIHQIIVKCVNVRGTMEGNETRSCIYCVGQGGM